MAETVTHAMDPLLLLCRLFMTAFVVMGAYHVWVERAALQSFRVRLRGELLSWACWLASPKRRCASGPEKTADDSLVQKKIDELIVQSGRCGVKAFAVSAGIYLASVILFWHIAADASVGNIAKLLAMGLTAYALCLAISSGNVVLTPYRLKLFYIALNSVFILKILSSGHMPHFLLMQSVRTMARAFTSLMVLDMRISCVVNALWSLVQCHHQIYRQEDRETDGIRGFVVVEFGTFFILQLLVWFARCVVESYARQILDCLLARTVQQAVRRLLSVLCDAEVHLAHGLEIRDASNKVAHILVPDQGIAGTAAIEGRAFTDFVAESDQGRFRDFLSENKGVAANTPLPAASIHVHLQNSTGHRIPVDLFHANLPDVEGARQPDHLIGIRESGGASTDAAVDAAPIALPPPVAPPRVAAASGQQPGEPQGVGGGAAPSGPGRLAPGVFKQEFNATRFEETSSQSSARSSGSAPTQIREVEFPELWQTEIRFDAMSADLDVGDVRLFFKPAADAVLPRGVPKLRDWVHPDMKAQFDEWLGTNLNELFNCTEIRPFHGLIMKWPSYVESRQQDLLIKVSEVAMELVESDDEGSHGTPGEGGTAATGGGCAAVLLLRGFKRFELYCGEKPRPRGDPAPGAGSGGQADDASSQTSSLPSRSKLTHIRKVALPELRQVKIRFDAFTEGQEVEMVRFRFKAKAGVGPDGGVPRLVQWVHESMATKFVAWVRDSIGASRSRAKPGPLGPLTMQWPSPELSRQQVQVWLEASKVAMEAAESDDESSQEEPEHQQAGGGGRPVEDEGGCPEQQHEGSGGRPVEEEGRGRRPVSSEGGRPAVLHLRGFKQIVKQVGRHHHRRHHAACARGRAQSVHSAQSGKLPSISEQGLGHEEGLRRRASPEGREPPCDP